MSKVEFSRRNIVALIASVVAAAKAAPALATLEQFGPATSFSWDWLVGEAQKRARRPFAPPPQAANPAPDFDAATRRAYGPAQSLGDLVRLLPVTRIAPMTVRIHLVTGGKARDLLSTRGLFAGNEPTDAAGFRVLDAGRKSDWLAYQGASYFRAAGSQDQYGLSARGIAVNTGLAPPEEFPVFTDFWVEVLAPQQVRVHAMLDGPSLAGAYVFDCTHGPGGVEQKVRAALFLRRDVERLGIAPGTSMFWYDQSRRSREADWRPEVHDSDGLAIWSGTGERIWRPLSNPDFPQTTSFRSDRVKGFGLIQRDRQFADYQDDGAFYERRPSLWVEPEGDWGPGAVFLYELPTNNETADNIVAFWRSDRPARAGERRDFTYTLRWTSDDPSGDGGARVVDLRTGSGGIPGAPPIPGTRKIVVDFEGPGLSGLGRTDVEADVNIAAPALLSKSCYPVVGQPGRWRVMLDIRSDPVPARELRLFLRRGASALSETLIQPLP